MAKSILIAILLLGVIGGKNCFSQFTFIVVSDPHFTGDNLCYEINRKMVEAMNSLSRVEGPGKYKKSKPEFVWMLGDMTESDREKFYNVIQQYNVIALFQGHNHSVSKFNWNNIDIWAARSPRHDTATGEYLVVQVSKTGELSVYERKYGFWK